MAEKTIKEIVMEKKNPQPVELNETAFSIVKNPNNGMWAVVKIKFDAATGTTGKAEFLNEDNDRSLVRERFKITVAQSGILGS